MSKLAPIDIPQHDLDDLRSFARDAVRASGLVELMHEIDPGPYGASMRVLELLHAVETGIACAIAVRRALVGRYFERIGTSHRRRSTGGSAGDRRRAVQRQARFV